MKTQNETLQRSKTKSRNFIVAYHEAGHLLGYLASDYVVPQDGGMGIVGDRFRFRRRGTSGAFKGHEMSTQAEVCAILTGLEGEIVGIFDLFGRAESMIRRTPIDTDFDTLQELKQKLGYETFEGCRIKSWLIVQDNLHLLRAAAKELYERRFLDAVAIEDLEIRYPLNSFFCCIGVETPANWSGKKVTLKPVGLLTL